MKDSCDSLDPTKVHVQYLVVQRRQRNQRVDFFHRDQIVVIHQTQRRLHRRINGARVQLALMNAHTKANETK